MIRKHVHRIAHPGNAASVGRDGETHHVDHGTGGTVLAGNPLRIQQRHRAGFHRHRNMHVKQPPRSFTGVHAHMDRVVLSGGRADRQREHEKHSHELLVLPVVKDEIGRRRRDAQLPEHRHHLPAMQRRMIHHVQHDLPQRRMVIVAPQYPYKTMTRSRSESSGESAHSSQRRWIFGHAASIGSSGGIGEATTRSSHARSAEWICASVSNTLDATRSSRDAAFPNRAPAPHPAAAATPSRNIEDEYELRL